MKLKEIDRNGNISWSPKLCDFSYLAVGTASQQLDSSFSTNAQLEIFKYVPSQKNWDMPVVASIPSESKFSKLLWGNAQGNNGFIIGGSENGAISIYNASLLLESGKSNNPDLAQIASRKEHKGAVNAMDFNKFKTNLLATGSSDSDIFIWDLEKLEEPMKPGNKTQPLEDILSLAWNHKVQHILASTSAHRCQIWDLRKEDPVIKLSDSQMKIKCKKVVWHPDISTRLCVSSEDDHTPVIQLWDLRYMQCPFHTLQKHTKGVVDLDWCLDDPDILMSVGKDRQMICWNMSTHNLSSASNSSSDVIYEWQLDQEWVNEARFCPKHPGLVSISSFDCHIGVYSLLGGRGHVPRELSDTVIDSFPLDLCNDDGQENEIVKKEAEKAAELQLSPTPSLLKAPKWLKRPSGARFSFGGKLVQFYKPEGSRSRNNSESQSQNSSLNDGQYKVIISQVVTDQNLVQGSNMLAKAVESPIELLNYCKDKVETITSQLVDTEYGKTKSELQFDRNIWRFIECHFEEDSRSAFMNNLGYSEFLFRDMTAMSKINSDFLLEDGGNEILNDQYVKDNYLFNGLPLQNLELLPQNNDLEKLLSVALMTGNIDTAVNICLKQNRSGEAAILAVSSGRQDLYDKVQNKILKESSKLYPTAQLISVAVKHNWVDLVKNCDLKDWRESLAWLLTYVNAEELGELHEILGHRLEAQSKDNEEYLFAACVCYICSGSIDNFVRCWFNCKSLSSNKDLQRLVEMIILLCKTIDDDELASIKGMTAKIITRYASLIASQGNLVTALTYLGENCEQDILLLRHRICQHLKDHQLPSGIKHPDVPFKISSFFNIKTKMPQNNYSQNQPFNKPIQRETGLYSGGHKMSDLPKSYVDSSHLQVIDTYSLYPVTKTNSITSFKENRIAKNLPSIPPISNKISTNFSPQPLSTNTLVQPNANFVPPIPLQFEKRSNVFAPAVAAQLSPTLSQTNQAPGSNSVKPSWNDPPLLSENYRTEPDRMEDNPQQQFYNPIDFTTENPDISALGKQFNVTSNSVSSYGQHTYPSLGSIQGGYNVTNSQAVDNTLTELSSDKQHWRKSFCNVIDLCRQRDNSRQAKVKMDEIQKKFDNWFEQLKTKPLSPELSMGLETLISLVDSNNFHESLNKVNQIMQNVNFSEAGSFLPSLKMLIQYAIKVSV